MLRVKKYSIDDNIMSLFKATDTDASDEVAIPICQILCQLRLAKVQIEADLEEPNDFVLKYVATKQLGDCNRSKQQ